MKNAPTTNDESAPDKRDYTPGTLPVRHNTVRAAVLAAMLEGAAMTGMESVFAQSTTRLAAVICEVAKRYGWNFDRGDVAVGTKDGRITSVTTYWLPQETIARAFALGARLWVDQVKAARADSRKNANKCKADAARINAMRRKSDPRQGAFWGDL